MSDSPDEKRDELGDRLMDQALREVLGGEAPPELSDKILAAVEKQVPVSPQRKERVVEKSKHRYRNWAMGAAAVCLLVGVGIALLLPAMQPAREAARRATSRDWLPSPLYMNDDVQHLDPQAEHELRGQPSDGRSVTMGMKAPGVFSADLDIPFPGEPPIVYPDAEVWHRLTARQKEEYLALALSGQGPGRGGDQYDHLAENSFRTVKDHPLSTFSIDVDTASYANVRRFLLDEEQLPPPDAVRIEELINYFHYDYASPEDDVPFAAHVEAAGCPWQSDHRLVRIGLKGKEFPREERPESNLVFLLDVSGSMNSPDKLPLLRNGMKLLAEQMRPNDRVAIVVYASGEGLVLPSTSGARREEILAALDRLEAGGSTNGGAGIELAYRIARENFIPEGVNRVLLCTDGDFNVGTTSTGDLVRIVEEKARSGVFLSVLGFGRGNLNDAMMEEISNKGNGNYAYIDGITEARKVLVQQMGGTLITIAKDVKIQVEFNPTRVAAYRLIGYENRILAAEDFNDDKKDAGEIGAGHTVTALYEVVPATAEIDVPAVDPLKYQAPGRPRNDQGIRDELLTLKVRYKEPDADTSKRLEIPFVDQGRRFAEAGPDLQFAAAVASFGMLLRDSKHKGTATYDAVLEIATAANGSDVHGYRAELLQMVRRAKTLTER